MDFHTFKRVLTSFADSPTNVDLGNGKLLCEVRDEVIEATVSSTDGEIIVTESGNRVPANKWLFRRIARLPILAERIVAAFAAPEFFISPQAELLAQLDSATDEEPATSGVAVELCLEALSRKPTGSSNVLYLTSDAGEGKTTLISYLAREQAELYKRKETDWLLVPIALGGRPFLRFDDIVVGYLTNHLRFPLFYYEAFIELVKLGVLVPAFDGFEEMFIQNASGDALSAVGNLMRTLDSSGTVLIAARKAYFEYQDIKTQARLFDSIGTCSVMFSRASLKRWEKSEFLEYCEQRHLQNTTEIYSCVAGRLGADHPLLTRAVLVKRLLDVAGSVTSLTELLQKIGSSPNDYFAIFVKAIIEREATEKWIDTSGEAAKPLLTVQEHFDLLSLVAQEMWVLSTESLKSDVLDLITEIFCESKRLIASVASQVQERTKQHALIVSSVGNRNSFSFDHEEFRNFFLGESVGRMSVHTISSKRQDLLSFLRRGALPPQAVQSAISFVRRNKQARPSEVASFLLEVAKLDGPQSFTQENIANLLIAILNGQNVDELCVQGLTFPPDILRDAVLMNIKFEHCTFSATTLDNARLTKCVFISCHFDCLNFTQTTRVVDCEIDANCSFMSIAPPDRDNPVFDPHTFTKLLSDAGFILKADDTQPDLKFPEHDDPDVKLLRRLLRHLFLRSTHINENVALRRLGPGAEAFIKSTVPRLVKGGVLTVEWIARDKQNRYRLGVSMERLNEVLSHPAITIDSIIETLKQPPISE